MKLQSQDTVVSEVPPAASAPWCLFVHTCLGVLQNMRCLNLAYVAGHCANSEDIADADESTSPASAGSSVICLLSFEN